MDLPKRGIQLSAFFLSQFSYCSLDWMFFLISIQSLFIRLDVFSYLSYCSLDWMFFGRGNDNKINRIHETCLRII